jgi:hypothetical protein
VTSEFEYFVRHGSVEVPVKILINETTGIHHAQADGPSGRSAFGIRTVCGTKVAPSEARYVHHWTGSTLEYEDGGIMSCERCEEIVIRRKVRR